VHKAWSLERCLKNGNRAANDRRVATPSILESSGNEDCADNSLSRVGLELYHGWGRPVGPRIKERLLGMFLRQETQTFRVCTHKETCAEIQKTVVDYRKVAGSRSGMLPLSLRLVAAAK